MVISNIDTVVAPDSGYYFLLGLLCDFVVAASAWLELIRGSDSSSYTKPMCSSVLHLTMGYFPRTLWLRNTCNTDTDTVPTGFPSASTVSYSPELRVALVRSNCNTKSPPFMSCCLVDS